MYTARYSEPRAMRCDNGYPVRILYGFASSRSRMPASGVQSVGHTCAAFRIGVHLGNRRFRTGKGGDAQCQRTGGQAPSIANSVISPAHTGERAGSPIGGPVDTKNLPQARRFPCRSADGRFKRGPPPDCITAADWISSDCILCGRRAACDFKDRRQTMRIRRLQGIPAGIPAAAGEIRSI